METSQADRPRCISCNAKLRGKFCHKCGEKVVKASDFELARFFREVFKKFTHLDSRVLRSFLWLIRRPGFLTAEYLRGHRRPYLKPIQLFFVVNLVYFLTIGFNGYRTYENPMSSQLRNPYNPVVKQLLDQRFDGDDKVARQEFEIRFDHQNHVLAKVLLILIVPLIALVLWMLYPMRYYGEHLITALHFQALMLVLNMVLGICTKGALSSYILEPGALHSLMTEVIEPLLWLGVLAFFTFRSVYGSGIAGTLWRVMVFAMLWLPVLISYRFVVFLATFYTA